MEIEKLKVKKDALEMQMRILYNDAFGTIVSILENCETWGAIRIEDYVEDGGIAYQICAPSNISIFEMTGCYISKIDLTANGDIKVIVKYMDEVEESIKEENQVIFSLNDDNSTYFAQSDIFEVLNALYSYLEWKNNG